MTKKVPAFIVQTDVNSFKVQANYFFENYKKNEAWGSVPVIILDEHCTTISSVTLINGNSVTSTQE